MTSTKPNTVRLHLTEGDLLTLERSLPAEVYRRSQAQHIVSRIITDARAQRAPLTRPAKEGRR